MVERAAVPRVSRLRRNFVRLARAMTTPLVPDDYIALINPAWSARELTGTIVRVKPETEDASTVVVRPNFPWSVEPPRASTRPPTVKAARGPIPAFP